MRVTSTGLTDVGMKRETNQDAILVNEDLRLYVVADGMGGHAGGETASRLAVETIEKKMVSAKSNGGSSFSKSQLFESTLPDDFHEAVEAACYTIFHAARQQPHLQGMGTTVTALLLKESAENGRVDAYLAHVGDSRGYLLRGDTLVQQISEDHSLVSEQIKAGVITYEEARQSRYRNIITRSVGFEEDVLVDVMGLYAEVGDVFLLCSDGLTNLVEDDEILEYANAYARDRIEEFPKGLVDLANSRGGDDNITVLVVRIDEI